MKLISDITNNLLTQDSKGQVVELISVLGGWKNLDSPTLSTELECQICHNKNHFSCYVDPEHDKRKVWICADGLCASNLTKFHKQATLVYPIPKRAILWPLFCEINGIGDMHYDVKFEDINQTDGKKSYMLKFANKPSGIIFMRGTHGLGKTFASLGICEMFTRTSTSCIFSTQRQMLTFWLNTFKSDVYNNYIDRVNNINLLVIDDFGTVEPSPSFMSFMMDLINTRMQWKDRGTIITTNLDKKKFSDFCGDALLDRINTGQLFEFTGNTRRKQQPL